MFRKAVRYRNSNTYVRIVEGDAMGPRAVVIGGEIGGLATALALARTGWQVTVLEQAREVRAVGAGITLAPNAVAPWTGSGSGANCARRGAARRSGSAREFRPLAHADACRRAQAPLRRAGLRTAPS
ncbi:hypothetical protein [Nonomuraea sp. NPDC023979]|uniref:NAD(P)-binding protein n=1 Tax=Nonomuraea sp. NPDC023979 TaxID=3154796 RepID=UPI0033F0AE13